MNKTYIWFLPDIRKLSLINATAKNDSKWFHNLQKGVCTPTPFCRRWEVEPPTKFSKRGALTGSQFLEGVTFFQGDCNFHIKNKLKSEIFNDKKCLSAKIFFSIITQNSNWEILPEN